MGGGLPIKTILVIGTGGTIASSDGPEGLYPVHNTDSLLKYIPGVFKNCTIHTSQILNLDSTNIQPQHWKQIAAAVQESYSRYDGFVITHGTDTMAYTAAALSYMIQNSRKPIVITGSQKPVDAVKTDATRNLQDSIRFACEDLGGVYIVFNGKVINGCRAVKVRTKSSNAFDSVNYPFVATIEGDKVNYNSLYSFPQQYEEVQYFPALAAEVFLLKLTPGVHPEIFDFLKGKYRGVVIEGFGSGGVPFLGDPDILSKIHDLTNSGVIIVITTQCLFEGGDLSLYEVGQKVLKSPVIPAYDMTTEAAVTKLMWALGQAVGFNQVKELFLAPVNNDVTADRTALEEAR